MSATQIFLAFLAGGMLATVYIARSLPKTVRRYLEVHAGIEAGLAEHQRALIAERAYIEAMQHLLVIGMALRLIAGPPRRISDLVPWDPIGRCPDCGGVELQRGPRGGASINLFCQTCGSRWNAVPAMQLIQRI